MIQIQNKIIKSKNNSRQQKTLAVASPIYLTLLSTSKGIEPLVSATTRISENAVEDLPLFQQNI